MSSARRSRTDVEQEVCGWLREYLKLGAHVPLAPETRINVDLGVDGEDGADLMRDFSTRFSIDLASLPSGNYFGPEAGASPLALLTTIWRWMSKRELHALAPLYLRDLVQAVLNAPPR
jgi:Protein of unknown function (DUF1493)